MLGHSKRILYVTVYLATGTENAVNQIMIRTLNNGSPLADLSDICKPHIDNIVEKTYSSVIPKRINDCQ
jgi:hypothetical protein